METVYCCGRGLPHDQLTFRIVSRYLQHSMKAILPPVLRIDTRVARNSVRQMGLPREEWVGTAEEFAAGNSRGFRFTERGTGRSMVVLSEGRAPGGEAHVLRLPGATLDPLVQELDLSTGTWVAHPAIERFAADGQTGYEAALASWPGSFSYTQADPEREIRGLRPPQLGALHAVQAHWALGDGDPATVVMPTGTGKTDTMISILIATGCTRLLVVVPTDALRTQIAEKFLTLGILPVVDVVSGAALPPVVGMLERRPRGVEDIDLLFSQCNVVVTTMAIAGRCPPEVRTRMAAECSHLFIDEAHHAEAPTWRIFRDAFNERRIVQFTATPYRNDGKPIGGRIVFNYRLRRAQEEDYFRPIQFKGIYEFNPERADEAIAEAAVEQLRMDYDLGHIVMARVKSIPRAAEVLRIYEKFPEFNPVAIHTGIPAGPQREHIRQQILSGDARIVVCVDMLGEGFDLPELKIAAFHDVRKSLPVTLQLAGRFTRSRPDLGEATFIANLASVQVAEELQKLYRSDVDWNVLLPQVADRAIQDEVALKEFVDGFSDFPDDFPLHRVRPAMSMVAYRTRGERWTPERFLSGIPGADTLDRIYHGVNDEENTLVVVTAQRIPVEWAGVDDISTWDWQLYILIWDPVNHLLFIHNSSNAGMFKRLAVAVAGGGVTQIGGPEVFRCFQGLNRLRLQNVGLIEQLGRLIRFTMRAGSDVGSGLTDAQIRNTKKSNIFASGFENGLRTTIGCSYKGRIWSRRLTNLKELAAWCRETGTKLIDRLIDPEQVILGTLSEQYIAERPEKMPIAIEWPEPFYTEPERAYRLRLGDRRLELSSADIDLVHPETAGVLRFSIGDDQAWAEFRLVLFEDGGEPDFRVEQVGGAEALLEHGSRAFSLAESFNEEPPTIWFADGSSLEGHRYVELRGLPEPFRRDRIEAWDWAGIDIRKEAQGVEGAADSIQYRVAERLRARDVTLVYDDDGSGESADLVAISEGEDVIDVEFYHCKYSGSAAPGARIKDLYEVCGQAQKSVRWMESRRQTDLFQHLLIRNPKVQGDTTRSRYERGSQADLVRIREKSRIQPIRLKVFIVQPGLSRAAASDAQLELLAVTENYLMETFKVPFGVIASI